MFLLPLVVLGQQQAATLTQKVTLDMRAVTGKELTQELSRRTGVYFEAADAAVTDRFLVTVRAVPLQQLMDKIAEAETGIWQNFGDNQYRLVRDRKKIEAAQTNERENAIKRFQKAFDKYRKDLGIAQDFSEDKAKEIATTMNHLGAPPTGRFDNSGYWERENELQQQLPVGRFLEKVVLGFTPEQLADLPGRTRTVYAVNPTQMQHPLPDDASDAVAELMKDEQTWEEALAKYLPTRQDEGWNGMTTLGRSHQITNAILAMYRWDDGSDIQVELTLVNAKGLCLCRSYLTVSQPPGPPRPPSKPGPPPKPEASIPLSQSDIDMASIFRGTDGRGTDTRTTVTDAMRAVIADPVKVDPFNTFVTDIIEGFAASRKQNIVAVLDDRILLSLARGVGPKGFDPRQIGNVGWSGAEGLDFGAGFFDMREQRPDRSDEINCSRDALQEMLTGSIAAGRLTVDLAANFAAPLERFDQNYIANGYLGALFGPDGANALTRNDRDLLRFYGNLDGVERGRASHLDLNGISGKPGELLNRLIFGDGGRLQVQVPPPTPEEQREPYYWDTVNNEPTIALGGGIPMRAYVAITSASDRAIVAHMQYGDYDQGNQVYDTRSLASISMDNQWDPNGGWRVLGMAAADRDVVKFDFKFSSTVDMNLELSSYKTTSSETTNVDRLPDDVRGSLLDALAQERKQRRGWTYGSANRNYGPP